MNPDKPEIRFTVERLAKHEGLHVRATRRDQAIDFTEAIARWQHDADFVHDFCEALRSCPFPAFFFETPPLTLATCGRAFEFVLIDSPALARVHADARSFRAKFDAGQPTATFANLSNSATLIVPREHVEPEVDCAHLASFTRTASAAWQRALWQASAAALDAELGDAPRWLSSSGLGVPWLHLRVDVRPKYYSYAPYRRFDASE